VWATVLCPLERAWVRARGQAVRPGRRAVRS
jgi:hypothetical protein